jgi:tRNA(fMet)-specific endonuclease VapC
MVIVDTNVFAGYLTKDEFTKNIFQQIGFDNLYMPELVAVELCRKDKTKSELEKTITFIRAFHVLHITEAVSSQAFALIKKYQIKKKIAVPDALIASFALVYEVELLTYNHKDFQYIEGLRLYT